MPEELLSESSEAAHRLVGENHPAISDEERAKWPELDERQKQLFAPYSLPEEVTSNPSFRYLFENNLNIPIVENGRTLNIKRDGLRIPNPDSTNAAIKELESPTLDPIIKGIIIAHLAGQVSLREIADFIYSNSGLREELARYLLSKITTNSHMPERVGNNNQKNPNHHGYEGFYTSQEYTAILAISKLDGSFKPEWAKGDEIMLDEVDSRKAIYGQHRTAADVLLSAH